MKHHKINLSYIQETADSCSYLLLCRIIQHKASQNILKLHTRNSWFILLPTVVMSTNPV